MRGNMRAVAEKRPVGIVPKPVEYNAEIAEIQYLSDTLAMFRVRPAPSGDGPVAPVDFTPGQYLTLGDNNPAGSTRRAYSISSPPGEKRWYELFIRRVSEENAQSSYPLTHILFDKKAGDGLWLGPKVTGRFTLQHTISPEDKRLRVFVAAGTGLAPFVSIVKNAMAASMETPQPFLVLHGSSFPHELGYRQDLEMTLNNMERHGYIPTISRPHVAEGWKGQTGRVEAFFDGEKLTELEERIGAEPGFLKPENAVVYVCGLQGTIANTIRALICRGFTPDSKRLRKHMQIPDDRVSSLYFEQYDTAPIMDVEEAQRLGRLLIAE